MFGVVRQRCDDPDGWATYLGHHYEALRSLFLAADRAGREVAGQLA